MLGQGLLCTLGVEIDNRSRAVHMGAYQRIVLFNRPQERIMSAEPDHLVNLPRYPLLDPAGSELASVVESARRCLDEEALCVLPEFLMPAAIRQFREEIEALLPRAIPQENQRTAYGWMNNDEFTPPHPRAIRHHSRNQTITLDLLPKDGGMRILFFWQALTDFVRRCLGLQKLYCSACPYLALIAKVFDQGDNLPWHYDTNDGVVSLLLQAPDEGGHFEYVPYLRSESDECYEDVDKVFSGHSDRVRRPLMQPGSLVLFKGRRSIHQVSQVGATTKPRLILLFSYDREPGMVFPEATVQAVIDPRVRVHQGI